MSVRNTSENTDRGFRNKYYRREPGRNVIVRYGNIVKRLQPEGEWKHCCRWDFGDLAR